MNGRAAMSRRVPIRARARSRGSLRGRANCLPIQSLATVIEREEVLAVARLARLELSEEELEPMARELSAVLEHVAKIGELDLDGVEPTSHVVDVTGALRPDEPQPCLPREVALAQAPAVSADGFLVPSPQA
jgi:aspartyl-tRNA(Asn)/glutamyl-tRNA(Gln) amidotransferase subunit C